MQMAAGERTDVADEVPIEVCAGVPVIVPVALLIDKPPGRLVAL
jgi:hypothetical protein